MKITLIPEGSNEALLKLKQSIERASIDEVNEVSISRDINRPGEMGPGGLISSIAVVIEAAAGPLVELVKCLQLWVENYRTPINIPTKNGMIQITKGRSMTSDELNNLVSTILKEIKS